MGVGEGKKEAKKAKPFGNFREREMLFCAEERERRVYRDWKRGWRRRRGAFFGRIGGG